MTVFARAAETIPIIFVNPSTFKTIPPPESPEKLLLDDLHVTLIKKS
jgi:hypothetical protein